jgi:tRNA nucleotidyltransferase/poly(A) polymerase
VGDPGERIKEDPLRLLRAVRLAAQLGFNMNNSAAVSITRNSRLLLSVPGERLKQELDKIMLSKRPAEGITLLDQLGLIKFLIPELLETKSFSHKSKNYHLEGTIYKHTLLAVDKAKHEELDLLYALLFHDIGKPRTAKKVVKSEGVVISTRGHAEVSADIFNKFAKKLRFPSNATKQVDWIIRNHMHFVDFYGMKIRKQMELAAHPSFELLLKHWDYDERANIRKIYLDQFHKKYLSSMKAGKDLLHKLKSRSDLIKKLSFGKLIMRYIDLKPGPALGGKIQDVKARILQGEIKNKRDLKAYLKS